MNDPTAKTTAEWPGIEETAGLLNFRIAEWHDLGYETPPTPDCKSIPPLGERSAEAIKAGHGAIEVIDEIVRDLGRLREQLVGELRADQAREGRAAVDAVRRPRSRIRPIPGSTARGCAARTNCGQLPALAARRGRSPPGRALPSRACSRREFRDHAGETSPAAWSARSWTPTSPLRRGGPRPAGA